MKDVAKSFMYCDFTLPASYGIPAISIPRLCPYCHKGCVELIYERDIETDLAHMQIACSICGTSRRSRFTYDHLEHDIHRNKFLLMNGYLHQISYLPPDMLLRPGDKVNFTDPTDSVVKRGQIVHISHGTRGVLVDILCRVGKSQVKYHQLNMLQVYPESVGRVNRLTQFKDRTKEALFNF